MSNLTPSILLVIAVISMIGCEQSDSQQPAPPTAATVSAPDVTPATRPGRLGLALLVPVASPMGSYRTNDVQPARLDQRINLSPKGRRVPASGPRAVSSVREPARNRASG